MGPDRRPDADDHRARAWRRCGTRHGGHRRAGGHPRLARLAARSCSTPGRCRLRGSAHRRRARVSVRAGRRHRRPTAQSHSANSWAVADPPDASRDHVPYGLACWVQRSIDARVGGWSRSSADGAYLLEELPLGGPVWTAEAAASGNPSRAPSVICLMTWSARVSSSPRDERGVVATGSHSRETGAPVCNSPTCRGRSLDRLVTTRTRASANATPLRRRPIRPPSCRGAPATGSGPSVRAYLPGGVPRSCRRGVPRARAARRRR